MAAAALAFTPRPTVVVLGRRLDPGSQPALYREVRRMAEAVGAEAPGQVVACLAPVLFVTELKVACLDGTVSGRTLCLPLPLARVLTVDELCALLAHELAHFSRTTEGYARRVVPFYIAAVRALERLDRRAHGIQAAAVWPPKELLRFFLSGMQEAGHNGHDEAEADRQAAAVCGPAALGSALVKVQAFAPAWHAVIGAMFDAVSARTQYVNASQLFAEVVASNAGRERLVGIGQLRAEHPSDRHPMLAERLTALDLPLAAIADAALAAPPAQAAVALVEGYAGIEQALSAAEHELIAATGADLPLPRTQ
jgi:hypothetical protein